MHALRRHQLAYLSQEGWRQILARAWESTALAGLTHWASQDLPLVVTRQHAALPGQPAPAPADPLVALGLPLPPCWQRQRLSVQLPGSGIRTLAEFPTLAQVEAQLPPASRAPLRACAQQLQALGLVARVYGSAGWQQLSGLVYLHERSDLDVWIGVGNDTCADAAARLLADTQAGAMRIDGELVFPDGTACAWREWRLWRSGHCDALLVKRLNGVALLQRPQPGAAALPGPTPWPGPALSDVDGGLA